MNFHFLYDQIQEKSGNLQWWFFGREGNVSRHLGNAISSGRFWLHSLKTWVSR